MKQQLTPILLPTESRGKKAITIIDGKYFDTHLDPSIYNDYKQGAKHFHIALVSDEKIKEGDFYISNVPEPNEVRRCDSIGNHNSIIDLLGISSHKTNCKKIIASTDKIVTRDSGHDASKDDYLPQISQDFIQYFVEKQGNVGKVMIEYEECETCLDQNQVRTKNPASKNDIITAPCSKCGCVNSWVNDHEDHYCSNIKPKLTKDNEVIISLEEKSYTNEDLVKVFNYAQEYTMVSRFAEDGFTFDHDLTHLPSFAKNL